ncbi:hypothetical protein [Marisediminicola senii]|uniref:hypothetical protein n=1 Tax=Marisediminicola senii TaxID=2711233 RepID=UPI0013E9ADC0|nr:hypothetical protein [Marisediminicola senii]
MMSTDRPESPDRAVEDRGIENRAAEQKPGDEREGDDAAHAGSPAADDAATQALALAASTMTPPAVLDAIARGPVDPSVPNAGAARAMVAANPAASAETLTWLAEIHDCPVILGVLLNPSTPLGVLRGFITSSNPALWDLLVQNEAVGDAFVSEVVDAHPTQELTLRALRNPGISDETFATLADRVEPQWQQIVDALRNSRPKA